MAQIPTLNNEQMIELAKNAANAYVSTNESIKQANVDDFLNVYLDVFTVAYSKVEQREKDKEKQMENFDFSAGLDELEPLPVNKIL